MTINNDTMNINHDTAGEREEELLRQLAAARAETDALRLQVGGGGEHLGQGSATAGRGVGGKTLQQRSIVTSPRVALDVEPSFNM